MKERKINNYCKAIVAIAVALAFVMPGSAVFASTMTSNVENTIDKISSIGTTNKIQTISTTNLDSNTIKEVTTFDPTTIYVDDDNTEGPWDGTVEHPYQYIQDSIDNGQPGDSVYIFNGLYNEGYQTHPSGIYEGLTAYKQGMSFTGESLGGVVIDPMHPSQMSGNAMFVTADDITLENIVFCNSSYAQYQNGLKLGGWDTRNQITAQANNCVVTNCISEDNQVGLNVEASSNVQISNLVIRDNQFYGAYVTGESSCTFTTCEILYTGDYQGVYIRNSPDCMFTDCTIEGSGRDAVYLYSSNGATFTNCDISTIYTLANNNDDEMWLQYCPEEVPVIMSVDEDNTRQGTVSLKDQYENEIVVPAYSIPIEIQYGMWLQYSFDDNTVLDTSLINPNDHVQKRSAILAPPLAYVGLSSSGSEYVAISGCTISGGLSFEYSAYATISNTDITDGRFGVVGESLAEYDYAVSTTTVDGDDVYYLNGENGVTIDGIDVGYLAVVSSTDITVKNMDMTGYAQGLVFADTTDSLIQNCIFASNDEGLNLLYGSSGNEIRDCSFSNNYFGLTIRNALSGNILSDNTFTDDTYAFSISGETEEQYTQNIDTSNTINGKPIAYIVGASDQTFDNPDVGFLGMVSCNNILLKNFIMSNAGQGLIIAYTTDSTIESCTLNNNADGFDLLYCSDVIVEDCEISNNVYSGMLLVDTTDTTINGCTFDANGDGIWGIDSEYNEVTDCTFNGCGIYAEGFSNNEISECSFTGSYCAVWFRDSSNNNQVSNSYFTQGSYTILSVYGSCDNSFTDCEIFDNYVGVEWHDDSHGMSLVNCDISNNYNGYYPLDANDCEIINCVMNDCDAPIPTSNVNNHIFTDLSMTRGGFGYCIMLVGNNAEITGCDFSYSGWEGDTLGTPAQGGGITLSGENAVLRDNILTANVNNLGIDGNAHDIDMSNTIDGIPVYYLVGVTDAVIDATGGMYVGLSSCDNVILQNVDLYNVSAFVFGSTTNSVLEDFSFTATYYGVEMIDSSYNIIRNGNAFGNWFYSFSLMGDSHDNVIDNYEMINTKTYHGVLWGGENSPYGTTISNCIMD